MLPTKIYELLRWTVAIFLPAAGVLYTSLAPVFGLPYAGEVNQTVSAVALFLGTIFNVSKLVNDSKSS